MAGTPSPYSPSSTDRAVRELAKSFSVGDHAIAAIGEKTRADLAAALEATNMGALASLRKLETDVVSRALDEFRLANAANIESALSTMNAAFGAHLAAAVEEINFSFKGSFLEAVRTATPFYSIDLAPHVRTAIAGAVELAEAPEAQDEAVASLRDLGELSVAERHALETHIVHAIAVVAIIVAILIKDSRLEVAGYTLYLLSCLVSSYRILGGRSKDE